MNLEINTKDWLFRHILDSVLTELQQSKLFFNFTILTAHISA